MSRLHMDNILPGFWPADLPCGRSKTWHMYTCTRTNIRTNTCTHTDLRTAHAQTHTYRKASTSRDDANDATFKAYVCACSPTCTHIKTRTLTHNDEYLGGWGLGMKQQTTLPNFWHSSTVSSLTCHSHGCHECEIYVIILLLLLLLLLLHALTCHSHGCH
jgi:hypothetical protein